MVDRVGQQIGSYKLLRMVGAGGFASVYLGEHVYLKTQAAIKLLDMQLNSEGMQNFLREAQIVAHLRHSNIVRFLEFGIEQDNPFLIMDYASHGTLRQRYPKGSRLSLSEILPYVQQIASALQFAHEHGLVHRDVKPENFLLNESNDVLLSDFGIAISDQNSRSLGTVENAIAGTVLYMAPEQLVGKARPASDQYALGAVVYEWLCGEPPFKGSFMEVSIQHLNAPVSPLREHVPTLSSALEVIVLTALSKEPQQRFASISAFANALEQVYHLENPVQPRTRLVLPGIAATTNFSAQKSEFHSIHSIPTETEGRQSSPPTPDYSVEDIATLEIVPGGSANPVNRTNYGSPTESGIPANREVDDAEVFIQTLAARALPSVLPQAEPPLPASASDVTMPAYPLMSVEAPTIGPEEQKAKNVPDRFSTIADRFDPTFVTALPEESDLSILDVPAPFPSEAYVGLSSEQIKEQLFAEGDAHYKARRYKEALSAYQRIIQLDEHDVQGHGGIGNALGRLGRYKEALDAYTTALGYDDSHASLWRAKGDMLSRRRVYKEALIAYSQALTLSPEDALTWKTKGILLSKIRDYQGAMEAYEVALRLAPDNASLWALKGGLCFKQNQYEEALLAYTRSLDLAPKKYLIWEASGDVYSKLKQYEAALQAYERASHLNPGNAFLLHKCEVHRELKQQQEKLVQAQTEGLQTRTTRLPPIRKPASTPPRPSGRKKDEAADKTKIAGVFDVFMSYSGEDAIWVEELAKQLEDGSGFQVWLDKWILIPGEPWMPAKSEAIEQARSCVVCIGETTPINWFEQEIQKAINRQKSEPASTFRVIPVLLPNARSDAARANLKNFLELNAWVDFRNFNYDYALHLLVSGIKGEPPGRWSEDVMAVESPETIAERKLRQLRRFNLEGIVDNSLLVEYQRQVLTKIWLSIEEDRDE